MKHSLFGLFLLLAVPISITQAQTWNEANNIGAGQSITAAGILELKTEIENLRTDVDAGSAGVWLTGAGGDIFYNSCGRP